MNFLPKGYKTAPLRKSKFFVTTKIYPNKKATCPRCGKEHQLEEGVFIKSKVVWKYVVCKNGMSCLVI